MSDQTIVTSCPQCSTSFKVTLEQLSTAKGNVRCGNCLTVFDAQKHRINLATKGKTQAIPASNRAITPTTIPRKNKRATLKPKGITDDFVNALQQGKSSYATASNHQMEQIGDHDESWAEELLRELENDEQDLFTSLSYDNSSIMENESTMDLDSLLEESLESEDLDLSLLESELNEAISVDIPSQTSPSSDEPPSKSAPANNVDLPDTLPILTDDNKHISDATRIPSVITKLAKRDLEQRSEAIPSLLDETPQPPPDDPSQISDFEPSSDIEFGDEFSDEMKALMGDDTASTSTNHSKEQSETDDNTYINDFTDLTNETWAKDMLKELDQLTNTSATDTHKTVSNSESQENTLRSKGLETLQAIQRGIANKASSDRSTAAIDEEHASDHSGKKNLLNALLKDRKASPTNSKADIIEASISSLTHNIGHPTNRQKDTLRDKIGFIAWGTAAFFALLLLFTQYLYVNFQTLATQDDYRPLYKNACDLLHCELPHQVAIGKLTIEKLVVREHPDERNALLIDVIMMNKALFPQPFPDMRILFKSINQQPLAYRRFQPEEYKGDIKIKLLPPNVPIHISLAIQNPGDDAVNYALSFERATP